MNGFDTGSPIALLSYFTLGISAVSLFVSLLSAHYARRQAIAAEGPRRPSVELASASWADESRRWLKIDIITRNFTNETWEMSTAILSSPANGKIVAGHLTAHEDGFGNWAPGVPDDEHSFTAETSPATYVLPRGAGPSSPHNPSGEIARETFYLRCPRRNDGFRIKFVFRSMSDARRRESVPLRALAPPLRDLAAV